jgi:disulfide oxidoreductase YuzD
MGSSFSTTRSPGSETTFDHLYDEEDYMKDFDDYQEQPIIFEEGDSVECRWKGGHRWYNAIITRKHIDGTYDIRYNDGDREIYLDPEFIRQKESGHEKRAIFQEGDFVEGRWKGGNRWYNAIITRKHMDGTYDIRYNDGDREIYLDPEFIRHRI